MKKLFALMAVFCLMSVAAFAQKKTSDFSGVWSLDVAKSQLGERSRIESETMTVAQTGNDLKVTTDTKRQAPPADAPQGGRPGGGGMGRGGFGGGDGTITYSLDGKETTVDMEGPNGKIPVKYKASVEGGKATLSSSRNFSGPMGDVSITTKETWALSDDGKTLTINRETTSPRGTNSTTMVFVKK